MIDKRNGICKLRFMSEASRSIRLSERRGILMSINKKTLLGRSPQELGVKDAVHAAIVSLRAGHALKPGEYITLNADREAIRSGTDGAFGIADPFFNGPIATGTVFWGILKMEEIPTVTHHWDHPKHSFEAPATEPKHNRTIEDLATQLGLQYEDVMSACQLYVTKDRQTPYSNPLSEDDFDKVQDEFHYELWSEWADESGWEFSNNGTECCPEYDYPDGLPFRFTTSAKTE